MRKSRLITAQGRTQTLAAWAAELDMAEAAIRTRLAKGWPLDRAVTEPKKTPAKITTSSGEEDTLINWASRRGVAVTTLVYRLESGWSPDEALNFVEKPNLRRRIMSETNGLKTAKRLAREQAAVVKGNNDDWSNGYRAALNALIAKLDREIKRQKLVS